MTTVGIIPARFASTRFPGKPLAMINGKPMVQWVYESASKALELVFVATDDGRIADAVERFGGKHVLTSPHHPSGTDRCAEALELIERMMGLNFDVVVNIQGDEPFVRPEQLRLLVEPFTNPQVQICTLAKPFAPNQDVFNPNSPKVVLNHQGNAMYFSRSAIPYLRAIEPPLWAECHPYHKHIGLYAFRPDTLRVITQLPQSPLELAESLEQLRWLEHGYSIRVQITHMETLAVDTPEDLERARGAATEQQP